MIDRLLEAWINASYENRLKIGVESRVSVKTGKSCILLSYNLYNKQLRDLPEYTQVTGLVTEKKLNFTLFSFSNSFKTKFFFVAVESFIQFNIG